MPTLGEIGEEAVVRLLEVQRWRVLARNYRCVGAEIDIIASKGTSVVFVEVKSRSNPQAYYLESLISRSKSQALWRGAQHYLMKSIKDYECARFDLAVYENWGQKKVRYYADFLPNCEQGLRLI